MNLRFFEEEFAVCKLRALEGIDFSQPFVFLSKTPDELSLVCPAAAAPTDAEKVETGWTLFRVEGPLDFSLVGILSKISALLAESSISLFAVSTFDTDCILIKKTSLAKAKEVFLQNGYVF